MAKAGRLMLACWLAALPLAAHELFVSGGLREQNPYLFALARSNTPALGLDAGFFAGYGKNFPYLQAHWQNEQLQIEAGFLNHKVGQGFFLSAGGYSASEPGLPDYRPLGCSVVVKQGPWQAAFFWYQSSLQASRENLGPQQLALPRASYAVGFRQWQLSVGTGLMLQKDKNSNFLAWRDWLFFLQAEHVASWGLLTASLEAGPQAGGVLALGYRQKPLQLQAELYRQTISNPLAAGIYQNSQGLYFAAHLGSFHSYASLGPDKSRAGFSLRLPEKAGQISFEPAASSERPLSAWGLLGQYHSQAASLAGVFYLPEENRLSPIFAFYQSAGSRGYQVSAGLGQGNRFQLFYVYSFNPQSVKTAINPLFWPPELRNMALRENLYETFACSLQGLQAWLMSENLSFLLSVFFPLAPSGGQTGPTLLNFRFMYQKSF